MGSFKIEITKDEMIRYYANKIVEDGIKESSEFNTTIDINNYGNISNYKNEILQRIYRDERVADVNLDNEGNFDMVFYTDFCPQYFDLEMLASYGYFIEPLDSLVKRDMFQRFGDYYAENCLFNNPYISIRNLINQFIDKETDNIETRDLISNIIKFELNRSGFISNNIDGIEVFVTPNNYKELEQVMRECNQVQEKQEQEELS